MRVWYLDPMAASEWNTKVQELIDDMGMSELSRRSGTSRTVIYKWLDGTPPTASAVIKFARGLGMSPIQALILSDYLTPLDVGQDPHAAELAHATDDALLAEVRRRFNR